MLALMDTFLRRLIFISAENSQHFMLGHTVFNDMSTYTYEQKLFPPFMLSSVVYITCPLNWVKLEVIYNIKF